VRRVCERPQVVGIPRRPRPWPRGVHPVGRSGAVPHGVVAITQARSSHERRKAGEEMRTDAQGPPIRGRGGVVGDKQAVGPRVQVGRRACRSVGKGRGGPVDLASEDSAQAGLWVFPIFLNPSSLFKHNSNLYFRFKFETQARTIQKKFNKLQSSHTNNL
jgi:hypothetical protein